MEEYQNIASMLALTMGASWASGINLYAALAVLGLSSATGSVELPPDLQVLGNPLVIGASCLMYAVEFVTDKIPGVDSAWDSIHTFIRIPAGAMLAAGAMGETGMAMEVAAAIMGGGMATATHATKAGSRVVINTSPEPFSNWGASVGEDVAVVGGLWTALNHPWIFLGCLFFFILFMIWLLPKIWQAIKGIFRFIGRLFGIAPKKAPEPSENILPNPSDKMEQLERLKRLLDSGALTEKEYAEQKRTLLG
ncbi:MAG: DUF4126 family protein [Gammaproteobacteria bacterium]|nr:DUF4126 family protein [Gammaproteobacteria bacterium]